MRLFSTSRPWRAVQARFRRAPGLRDRYIAVALLLAAVVVTAAAYGRWYVLRVSEEQAALQRARQAASQGVEALGRQGRLLESRVQRFLIRPTAANRAALEDALLRCQQALAVLEASGWREGDAVQAARRLSGLLAELGRGIERLVRQRRELRLWLPAMQVMEDEMFPRHREFVTILTLAIEEARDPPRADAAAYDVLVDLRHAWLLLINEFRLYVANRLGVFTSRPQRAMAVRLQNIEAYSQQVERLLEALEAARRRDGLGFYAANRVEELRRLWREWFAAFRRVVHQMQQEGWRRDLPWLQRRIDPLFAGYHAQVAELRRGLEAAAMGAVAAQTELAYRLSRFLVVLAAGGLLVLVAGYLAFRRWLLDPITRVTAALRAEAEGETPPPLPDMRPRELHDLLVAFEEMRRQVRARQLHLAHVAQHDALTGLPNRNLFRDRLEQALARARREERLVALMFLDLDRFKQINDSLGHEVGDRLLAAVAERLGQCVRRTDTVARLGGDEFTVIMEGVTHVDQAAALAEKILAALRRPFRIDGQDLHINASLGIVLAPFDDQDADGLIRAADLAMYSAKDAGRGTYRFFSVRLLEELTDRVNLEDAMHAAVEAERFFLHYQPVVRLADGRVLGYEALLRLRREDGGVEAASGFIEVLEDSGLIVPVTRRMFRRALQEWPRLAPRGDAFLALNLSARVLQEPRLVDALRGECEAYGVPTRALVFQVSEAALLADPERAESVLAGLRGLGARIALDGFGTGQSSLTYLRHFPIDIVEIDRSLLRDLAVDANARALVRGLAAMADGLGLECVAEGVETEGQREMLRGTACHAAQGFLFGRPAPPPPASGDGT